MDAIKAIVLGGILSGIISLIIGSQGSSGGQLGIHLMHAGEYAVHWSWPLFLGGTALSYALMVMQR